MMLILKHLTAFLLLLLTPISCIRPTRPILVNPNTQNSPANIIFYFSLENNLPSTDYLMIGFSPYTADVVKKQCLLLDQANIAVENCIDLSTGTDLTITASQVYEFNPNIDANKVLVVKFNQQLTAGIEYILQILTDNVLPNIGSITSNFQLYTVTDTGVVQEENWNFGQVFLEPRQNNVLAILNRNSMTQNLPGKSFTNLLFEITIGEQTPTPRSRLKFIISDQFVFTDSSLVTSGAIVGSAPAILSSQIVSQNMIITTFNESFTVGRKFSIRIADYLNPLKITSGWISVYHLPENSMSPLQISEQSIPISTIPFDLTLTLLTIDRTVPSSPIQMYTSTTQYLTLDILLPRKVDSNFIIQIQSDVLDIHEGSVYFKTSTVQMQSVSYQFASTSLFVISGFPEIPTGTLLSVTMEVTHPVSDKFKFYVSIDTEDQISNPIMYKQITSVSAAIPVAYITSLTGNSLQPNVLTSMTSITESKITFTVTPNFDTNDGSSLSIIGPAKLKQTTSFNPAASCLVNSTAEPCTIVTGTTYTNITIASNSSFNLFTKADIKNIVINNIKFDRTSSHTLGGVYHLYFSMRVSQAVDAVRKNQLKKVVVMPQREQMGTGGAQFDLYISNNLRSLSSNYPNIVRLVSKSTAQWGYTIQVYERRIISLFALQGWTNCFTDLNSGDTYPGNTNLVGAQFIYKKGSSTTLSTENPLDWDRIDIIMQGDETTTDFSIFFPTTFIAASITFQVFMGIYNVNTRTIKYVQMEAVTQFSPPAVLLTSKPKVTGNKIQLRGASAASKDSIEVTITTGVSSYEASTFAAALITVSDWKYFEQSSTFSTVSLNNAIPDFNLVEQTPLSIYLPNNNKYLTYIPLSTGLGVTTASFSVFLDNIRLPYSHDLPYYSIFLVDKLGSIDCYNEFINQDKGVFYESYFRNLAFSCNVNSLGVTNTYCTIVFNNTMKIMEEAVIKVYFTGMLISTNMCEMRDATNGVDIPVNCQSNVDKNTLTVNLQNTERLDELQMYEVLMYGVSIKNTTNIQYVSVELRDSSSSYIIEHGQRILMTSVQVFMPITIYEVSYTKNNPIVYSEFKINFNLPRQLNNDEKFALVMSKDLTNLNTIQSKLNIVLKDASNVSIPIIWRLSLKNYMIVFEDLISVLTPSNYTLYIYGIKTPSTIEQDLISIIYLRTYDSAYTVSNNANSTAEFPPLVSKVDSKITVSTKFNTEGLQHELNFVIINQYAVVTVDTVWIINFPRYYSERLWNAPDEQKYCTIDGIKISCEIDFNNPYQMKITNSPRIIEIGDTYEIKVYGIVCPRDIYLNGAADYVTESIFFGIAQNSSSQSYVEYSELFVTDNIITIESLVGYGDIILTGVSSSNNEILQTTFFVLTMESSQDIDTNEYIFLTFPAEFDNFNDISLIVVVKQGAVDETYTAQVVNRRIGFQLSTMSLTAGTPFDIQISSLPNPTQTCIIDMNKIKIMVASSTLDTTTAASLQRHNLVSTMQFVESGLHIVINNYTTIQVTAGTYSLSVLIQPSSFTTFQSNMKILFVSDALFFNPSPTYAYLGQAKAEFKIGADQNLIPKIYAFDIIKSETSISAVYASLSKYTVSVTNTPVVIDIPATLNVPLGGCSVPYLIQLKNIPFESIELNFEYDSALFNMQLFWMNEQTSYNSLEFANRITQRWVSFCSSGALTEAEVIVQPYISGINQKAYQLSSTTITVSIISNATTNKTPTLSIVEKNIQKTYAGFEVTTNLNGQLYYELKVNEITSPINLIALKEMVKEGDSLILEKESQYLSRIYSSDRDHRVGIKNVNAGVSPFEFEDLLPERKYALCVYFENQHRITTTGKCIEFTTMSWGTVLKASVTFNSTVYQNQLNKVLCFFVRASSSLISQVVNLDGHSCSLSSVPQNYNYLYRGISQTNELQSTLIYFITNKNLTTDPSQALFKEIFNSSAPYSITATSLSVALSSFSINYITSSNYYSEFDPIQALTGSILKPSISVGQYIYNSQNELLTVPNISLSEAGSIYFLVVFNKRIIKNQISNHYDIEIQETVNPSPEAIFNCEDSAGKIPLACKRIVLTNNAQMSVSFSSIALDSMYIVYYVAANEYPLRPIFIGDVKNITVDTSSIYENHSIKIIMLTLAFLFMITQI